MATQKVKEKDAQEEKNKKTRKHTKAMSEDASMCGSVCCDAKQRVRLRVQAVLR